MFKFLLNNILTIKILSKTVTKGVLQLSKKIP